MREYYFKRISGHAGLAPKGSFVVTAETVKDAVREAQVLTSYKPIGDGGIVNGYYVVSFRVDGVEKNADYTVTPAK